MVLMSSVFQKLVLRKRYNFDLQMVFFFKNVVFIPVKLSYHLWSVLSIVSQWIKVLPIFLNLVVLVFRIKVWVY